MAKLPLLLVLCSVTVSLPVLGQTVRFEHDVLFAKLRSPALVLSHPLVLGQKHLFGDLYEVTTTDAILLENDLRQNAGVEWVEKSFLPEAKKHEVLSPKLNKEATARAFGFNDPKTSGLWGFRDAASKGISIEKAYANMPARTPHPVVVAVIDTGVDYRHEDLRDVMWKNPNEIPGNGIDDDRNGYVDDVYGVDILNGDSDPAPTHFHGTHVAGTIAATQNNGVGVAGVASHARIMAIRTIPDARDESDRDVINSLLYAARNGARVINCSFGKRRQSKTVQETIDYVGTTHEALVVAASGNDSKGPRDWHNIDRRAHFPSSFTSDTMLVVTATSSSGGLADFANVGARSVDVAAPGDNILSTIMRNRYAASSGTSMATPMVAGIAAQLLAYYPQLTALEVKTIIMESVVKVEELKSKTLTGGRADLARAMEYAAQYYSHR